MTLRTRLTERLDLEHPVISAPMAFVAGGALAAAVSRAGGLGFHPGRAECRCQDTSVGREEFFPQLRHAAAIHPGEVFNGHEPERARDFFTHDAQWHGPSVAEVTGVDNIVGLLGAFIGALSDVRAEEQDVIASGDLVALRLVVTATQTGDMLGIPASGRDVRWDAVDIYRVTDDGKISEQWAFEDMAAIGSQLGAFSLPWAG